MPWMKARRLTRLCQAPGAKSRQATSPCSLASFGWDYNTGTSTLTFYGSYCTQLKTRVVDTVDVVYDCNGPLL